MTECLTQRNEEFPRISMHFLEWMQSSVLAVVDDTVTWIDHVAGQLVQSSRIRDVQTVKAECWQANFKKSSTIQ